MKNKLSDLNNHLFEQLERLNDEQLSENEIHKEVKRAQAMVGVADQITNNASLQLQAARLFAAHGEKMLPMLPQIGKAKE